MSVISDLKYQKLSALLGGSRTISDLESEWLSSFFELVTNGTFDSDITGWTIIGGTAPVASGQVSVTADGTQGTINQSLTTVIGVVYTLSLDCIGGTSGGFTYRLGNTLGGVEVLTVVNDTTAELKSHTFTAISTTTYLSVRSATATATESSIYDNISTKQTAVIDKDINSLWNRYWDSLSIASGDTPTRKFAWLGSLGFTGTISERESRYWTAF